MTKSRSQQLSEKANEERQRCRAWVLRFMQNNQPKFLTKAELRDAAIRELNASKNSFDFGWVAAIEDTGRHDWSSRCADDYGRRARHFPSASIVTGHSNGTGHDEYEKRVMQQATRGLSDAEASLSLGNPRIWAIIK
jgi:hypothetical protein